MLTKFFFFIIFLLFLFLSFQVKAQLQVKGRFLTSPHGEKIILRGVNKMIFFSDRDGVPSYREISKTGANVARIFWFTTGTADELDETLTNCISEGMIPMPSVWEATGKWSMLKQCVDYWSKPEIVEVIKKHEDYILLNIANEAGDHEVTDDQYRAEYKNSIKQLRNVGIRAPLVIDAAGWGRSEDYLINNAHFLLDQDPLNNLMFSWHPWDINLSPQKYREVIEKSIQQEICMIIGEFSEKSVGCACCIDYQYLLEITHKKKIGLLAWSWGPGNGDCAEMDMTEDGNFNTLHGWGKEVAIDNRYSIQNTSKKSKFILGRSPE